MTPREPDRFDKIARDITRQWDDVGTTGIEDILAAALRAEAADTLEAMGKHLRATAESWRVYEHATAEQAYETCIRIVFETARALASPAAAPAADVCRAEVASRMPDYSHYECTLPKGHAGPHKEGSFAEWTDATTVAAPPPEPAAPEKEEKEIANLLGRGHVENPREGEPGDAETYSSPAPLLPRVLVVKDGQVTVYSWAASFWTKQEPPSP